MRLAFAAGAVVGVLAPAVGFFLVQRRMSLIGDGIGHVAFAGVAFGYLIGISPVATALVASVIGAIVVEWLRANRRTAGDQALALLFYTGIALGVVLISAAGALNANLFSFLFGSILTVRSWRPDACRRPRDRRARVDRSAVPRSGRSGSRRGRSQVSGVPVGLLNVLLAGLAGVTIALSMRIVGILLIAALMVLPVTAASRLARSVSSTLAVAMIVGLLSVFVGLTVSYYADLAPGGAIVLTAAGAFALAALVARSARSPDPRRMRSGRAESASNVAEAMGRPARRRRGSAPDLQQHTRTRRPLLPARAPTSPRARAGQSGTASSVGTRSRRSRAVLAQRARARGGELARSRRRPSRPGSYSSSRSRRARTWRRAQPRRETAQRKRLSRGPLSSRAFLGAEPASSSSTFGRAR